VVYWSHTWPSAIAIPPLIYYLTERSLFKKCPPTGKSLKKALPDSEYILSLSRGGLWTPCDDLIAIGFEIEKTFRYETVAHDVTKPVPISELRPNILSNPKISCL
jgi:hypothetical protein